MMGRMVLGGMAAAALLVLGLVVRADIGPKPTMSFRLLHAGRPLSIEKGLLYQCSKSDCSDAAPLRSLGPQHFSCTRDTCDATAYGFAKFSMLELVIPHRGRLRSKPFSADGMRAQFDVKVRGRHLVIIPDS